MGDDFVNKYEYMKLKELYYKELEREKRINELLDEDLVKEYLTLNNLKYEEYDVDNKREILDKILENYIITKTNNLYVCIGEFYTDVVINYEETVYRETKTDFNSKHGEYRIYRDVENKKNIKKYLRTDGLEYDNKDKMSKYFEENNVVFNPFNSKNNNNGYEEVRYDFFINTIECGQAKSRKLLLKKYNRM